MVEQSPNVAPTLLPQIQQGLDSPLCRLRKEGDKSSFVVVHQPMVADMVPAINKL